VASADVLIHKDVATRREVGLAELDGDLTGTSDSVRRARHQKRQRRPGRVAAHRAHDDSVQLRSIARWNHGFKANVVRSVVVLERFLKTLSAIAAEASGSGRQLLHGRW